MGKALSKKIFIIASIILAGFLFAIWLARSTLGSFLHPNDDLFAECRSTQIVGGAGTIGGAFSLINQDGETVSDKDVITEPSLVYFGYTFCPDVCPMDILKISNFIGKYPNIKKEIDFIFITVDPERDKPQVLREFLSNFNQEIIGLSGSNEKVSATLSKFRIYAKKNNTDSPKDDMYLVDHSSLIFFMDENDSYITHFNSKYFENQFTKYVN